MTKKKVPQYAINWLKNESVIYCRTAKVKSPTEWTSQNQIGLVKIAPRPVSNFMEDQLEFQRISNPGRYTTSQVSGDENFSKTVYRGTLSKNGSPRYPFFKAPFSPNRFPEVGESGARWTCGYVGPPLIFLLCHQQFCHN